MLSDLAMQPLGGEAVRDEITRRQLPLARHFVFPLGFLALAPRDGPGDGSISEIGVEATRVS